MNFLKNIVNYTLTKKEIKDLIIAGVFIVAAICILYGTVKLLTFY